MDEFGIIERFSRRQTVRREDVVLGIGDDAAVVEPPAGSRLAITTDVLIEGVHFPARTEPSAIGHKSLAVNLSDIAAMGARPAWATMCLTLPHADERWLDEFWSGFFALAERHDVELVGGDIAHGPLSMAVQIIGLAAGGYLPRGGARESDVIYVSGTLGDAALGLKIFSGGLVVSEPDRDFFMGRLNRPTPRVELGLALSRYASAAIDISDGLAADLGHLCESSGTGAVVDVARLPLSDGYRRLLATVGWEPVTSFGDDYELCFTVPPANIPAIEDLSRRTGLPLTPIGTITGSGIQWTYDGRPFALRDQGYQHFR